MSFAIYEILGLIISLPLSYAMARIAKIYTFDTYKDEVDRLFAATWNGKEEDELNAWLKVKSIYLSKKAPKKKKYISKRIQELDHYKLLSRSYVDDEGKMRQAEELKSGNRDLLR